jgi:hypothetical protein
MFKHQIVITAGLLALGIAGAGQAFAQAVPLYPAATALPPYEIVAIVRSTGLEPLSRPVRHGPIYALHAVDPAGHPVRVMVDARLGRIVRVAPAAHPRFAAPLPVLPPPYARPPAAIAMVPDGYGPGSRVAVLPPSYEAPYGPLAGRERLPLGPGRPTAAATPDAHANPTPLPRPRPQFAAAEPTPAATVAPQAPPAAHEGKDVAPGSTNAAPPAPVIEQHE